VAEAAVELVEATKSYGQVEALRGVSLRIEPGDVVAMLGPNGAGKTTAINLMLGIRRPTAGSARLFGLPPGDRAARSRCGVMLQESGVSGALKVGELVELFRTYYPNPMPARRALEMAGLVEQADTQSAKLSGGQRQRLYFALAVAGDPDLLFLDEPTVGMDVESRRAFLDGIRRFAAEGKTIVLTTHYLEEADELARRVVVIDRGLVIADASPREIKSRVAGKRVRFVSAGVERSRFEGLPYSDLEIDADHVRILSSQPEALLREVFARGIPVAELEVAGADLEEAFITLTGDRRREAVS
jgi:ABC-2 type transport system ATP-binding protein